MNKAQELSWYVLEKADSLDFTSPALELEMPSETFERAF